LVKALRNTNVFFIKIKTIAKPTTLRYSKNLTTSLTRVNSVVKFLKCLNLKILQRSYNVVIITMHF
jgi:hypothetical protein